MSEVIWIHFALPRTAWYGQSGDRRRELQRQWADVGAVSRGQGASSGGQYHVRGQSDYSTVEVWRFTDAEAAFDHWARLTAAGYSEWFQSSNSLGSALQEAL
jgi:hypothetical protein